jgi:hypothetical protein
VVKIGDFPAVIGTPQRPPFPFEYKEFVKADMFLSAVSIGAPFLVDGFFQVYSFC